MERPRWNRWLARIICRQPDGTMGPLRPTPKQTAFLMLEHDEVMYGGAAGGAKTAALLLWLLQYVDVPGYTALMLRRTAIQLSDPGGLLDLALTWLNPFIARKEVRFDGQKNILRFGGGGVIKAGHLDSERDLENFSGPGYVRVGIDEVTQFKERMVNAVRTRNRAPDNFPIRAQLRFASNPGGVGHEWVHSRFVDLRSSIYPYLPAKLRDNPYLNRVEYEAKLAGLDPITRRRLLDGDWSARIGGGFKAEWFKISGEWPGCVKKLRAWDLAASAEKDGEDRDYTAATLGGLTAEGQFAYDPLRFRESPAGVEARIRQQAEIDGKKVPIWMEVEPGASGISLISHYQRHVLAGWEVHGEPKRQKTEILVGPLASAAEGGHVTLIRGSHTKAFLDEWEIFPNGDHDDILVSMILAHQKLTEGTSADNWLEFYKELAHA